VSDALDRLLAQRRGRVGRTRRVAGLLGAAALHVAVVGAMVFGPELFAAPPRQITYVPVQLIPAPALGRPNPAPPRRRAEPAATPPPAPAAESTPPPAPAPEPEPEPAEAPRPAERTAPAPPAAPEAAPPSANPPGPRGAAGGNPASPFTAAGGTVDNPTFTYGYYLDRMVLLIRGQWVRPQLGSGPEAVVHFRILRDGKVEDVKLVSSSGYNSFDLAALRAVQAAAPLPPLPRSYREGDLGVTLIFR
jgi:TonB family protein